MPESKKNDARQLRKLNFDLANYFSNTRIPQLFVDADLVLRIFTPPAMEQFSLTYADVNRDIHEVKDNIRYPTIVENIEEVIATGKVLEKEVQTTDGRWYQMDVVPYIEQEQECTNGVILTFIDITKRLRSLRELEKLNAQHNVLMFALSHDIRQPTSTIVLLAGALLTAHQKQDSVQFNKWIEALKDASQNIKSLVDDFTYDNEVRSKESAQVVRINIEDICRNVLTALREEIEAENALITTDFNISEIQFRRNNLRSIVYNLLHNAIKYRDRDRAPEITITTTKIPGYVRLCVKDNGVGIAEEHQRSIFQKSSRINESISGTGMGLYIIKKMIENEEGRIELQSVLGKGSTFTIFFKSGYSSES